MRRVVFTGIGIVSCIGNDKDTVLESLQQGRSGITFSEVQKDMGFRSHVHGKPEIDLSAAIDRRWLRFMGDGAAYNYIAMEQAIADFPGSGGSDRSTGSSSASLTMLGEGGVEELIPKAKTQGLDVVLYFKIRVVKSTRTGLVTNITVIKVVEM